MVGHMKYKLEGMLIPFDKTPIFINIQDNVFLSIFNTKEKFDEMAKIGKFADCKVIVDVDDFMKSIEAYRKNFDFGVIADPYITGEGNTCYQLLDL